MMQRWIWSMMIVLTVVGCSDKGGGSPDRSTTLDRGQPRELAVFPDGPATKVDGPATKVDGPVTKVDGPVTKVDGPKPKVDGPVTKVDGPKPKVDTAPGPLNCDAIGACSETCSKGCGSGDFLCLLKCKDDCRAKACASAQTVFDTLFNCINANCILDCIQGATPACKTCTGTKCSTQTTACSANKC